MSIQTLLDRLDGVRRTGDNNYIARCPSHDDKSPSLSMKLDPNGKILVHCFAGCSPLDVLAAIGLEIGDLFPEDFPDYIPADPKAKYKKRAIDHEVWMAEMRLKITTSHLQKGGKLTTDEIKKAKAAKQYLIDSGKYE